LTQNDDVYDVHANNEFIRAEDLLATLYLLYE